MRLYHWATQAKSIGSRRVRNVPQRAHDTCCRLDPAPGYLMFRNISPGFSGARGPLINKRLLLEFIMFDFIRLLELSGLLLESEQISPDLATRIFKHYGATDEDLKSQNLKKTYFALAKKYHPDLTGGDHKPMQYINLAYEVLSKATPSTNAQPAQTAKPTKPEPYLMRCPNPSCRREIISSWHQCMWCKTILPT